jgi:hypothetical protein
VNGNDVTFTGNVTVNGTQGLYAGNGNVNAGGNVLANGAFYGQGQIGPTISVPNTTPNTAGAYRTVPFTNPSS